MADFRSKSAMLVQLANLMISPISYQGGYATR